MSDSIRSYYSGVFVLLIPVMPIDNLVAHARIRLFQSSSFKCFLKDYIGSTLNLGNHLSRCYYVAAVSVVVPSTSIKNLNFFILFVVTKSSYLFFPKFQTSSDKLINKLLIKLLLICCDDVPRPKKKFRFIFVTGI